MDGAEVGRDLDKNVVGVPEITQIAVPLEREGRMTESDAAGGMHSFHHGSMGLLSSHEGHKLSGDFTLGVGEPG
jgi:hypothetical protein